MGTVHTGGLVQQRSLRGSRRQILATGPVKDRVGIPSATGYGGLVPTKARLYSSTRRCHRTPQEDGYRPRSSGDELEPCDSREGELRQEAVGLTTSRQIVECEVRPSPRRCSVRHLLASRQSVECEDGPAPLRRRRCYDTADLSHPNSCSLAHNLLKTLPATTKVVVGGVASSRIRTDRALFVPVQGGPL